MMMRKYLLALALLSALTLVPLPAAHAASIWTPISSGTASDITGIAYQSDTRFWFVTGNGEIFTRQPGGAFQRTWGPSYVRLNDIAFQPGGSVGIAVGDSGQVLRSANGGASWTPVTSIPVSANHASSTFPKCDTSTYALGDVNSVRFASTGRVWIFAEGSQVAKSEPATQANVGAAGTWVDANRNTDGTCKLAQPSSSYNSGIDDAFFTANPDVAYFCTGFFGPVYFTTNDLATTAALRPADCGNGDLSTRRMAGDLNNPAHQWAVAPSGGAPNLSYTAYTSDGWATSSRISIVNSSAHPLGNAWDVASNGGTTMIAGDGGMILSNASSSGAFFNNSADGALASEDWRAVAVASATQAAVGGTNGALVVTSAANTLPKDPGPVPPGTPNPTPSATVTLPGKVGSITLAGPTVCVAPGASVSATLTYKRRKKAPKVRITKVIFAIDGAGAKTDKRPPFAQTLTLSGLTPGSRHTLTARAYVKRAKSNRIKKVLVSTGFSVCSS